MWELLQSRYFAKSISREVARIIGQEVDDSIEFEKVSIQFFPPGVTLGDIKIKADKEVLRGSSVNIYIDEIKLQFDLLSLLKNKIAFDNVVASGGSVRLDIQGEKRNKSAGNLLAPIFLLKQKALGRVNEFILQDLHVESNTFNFYLKYLKLPIKSSALFLHSKIFSVELMSMWDKKNNKNKINIDEIKFGIEIGKKNIQVNYFEVFWGASKAIVSGEIEGDILGLKKLDYRGRVNIQASVHDFKNHIPFKENMQGVISSTLEIKGKDKDIVMDGNLEVENLTYSHLNIPKGNVKFKKQKSDIVVISARASDGNGFASIKKEFKLFNLSRNEFYPLDLIIHSRALHLKNFLPLGKSKEKKLEAILTGDIRCITDFADVQLSSDQLIAKRLVFSNNKKKIISYKDAKLSSLRVVMPLSRGDIYLKSELELEKTLAKISGYIGDNIELSANFKKLDLQEVVAFKGVGFQGRGKGSLKIVGTPSDLILKIGLNVTESGIVGYRLGTVNTQIDISLNRGLLQIKKGKLIKSNSFYSIEGIVGLQKNIYLDLDAIIERSSYSSLKDLIFPVSNKIKYLPANNLGDLKGRVKVKGYVKELQVFGQISGQNLVAWKEEVSHARASFLYRKNILDIKEVVIKKGSGHISGNYKFNMENKKHRYSVLVKGIKIHEFENINPHFLGLDGTIEISGLGQVNQREVHGKFKMALKKASVAGHSIPNSSADIEIKNGMLGANVAIFNDDISLKSKISLRGKKKPSQVNMKINTIRIKELLGVFSPHSMQRSDISGKVHINIMSNFFLEDLKKINLSVKVEDFHYASEKVELKKTGKMDALVIERGRIKRDKIIFMGPNSNLSMILNQSKNHAIDLLLKGNISANIIKLLDKHVLSTQGMLEIESQIRFLKKINDLDIDLILKGKKIGASYAGVPVPLEKLNFLIVLDSNQIHFRKLRGKLGGGDLNVEGNIFLITPFPVFNLKYTLNKSKVSLARKSNIWISSHGEIVGDDIPYIIKGNISLISGNVLDEFNEFTRSKNAKYINPYMPYVHDTTTFGFFSTDLSVATIRPLYIRNSLVELSVRGRVKVLESLSNPKIKGRMELVPGTGRLYFKGNYFTLKRGTIEFKGQNLSQSNLDFLGVSKIGSHDVILGISGAPNNLKLELGSSPNLPENEVLSLLTIGVTSDSTSQLSDRERESIASLGIGSLIFDRFQINQELKSELGVNVSVTSELVEDEQNYFTEPEQTDSSNPTKISIDKKITENITIKASSTVGGDISQKKEMNVNYNINNNLSLEGVYELKDSEEELGDSSDALGADIKFRFEF